jgi:hypothetical protein
MKHNKRQKEGVRERLAVLAAFEPCAARFFDFVLAEELEGRYLLMMALTHSLHS